MTTGSVGPTAASVQAENFVGTAYSRNWSGINGKYEVYAGKRRLRWNNFTGETVTRTRNKKTASIVQWGATASSPTTVLGGQPAQTSGKQLSREPSWSSNDDLELQSKLLKKIKGSDFNLAVNLSQMNQTVGMLSSTLSSFGRAVMALKHGDFAKAARTLGVSKKSSRLKTTDISGRWLELQYGWLPAVSDVYNSAKLFHAMSEGPRSAIIRTSKVKLREQVDGSIQPTSYHQYYKCVKRKSIEYEMYEEMSAPRVLGLEDPWSVVWENVPYSFVVDWFVPIGTYLEDLNGIPNLKGRFLTTTSVLRLGMGDFIGVNKPFAPFAIKTWFNGPVDSYRAVEVNRVFSNSLSVPLPSFKLGGAVHGKRVWNAIALAYQRFKR